MPARLSAVRGRSVRAGRPLLVGAVLLGVLAGCIGGGEPLPIAAPQAPVEADAERIAALAESLTEAGTEAEREAVLTAALRSAGVAPLADARVPGGIGTYRVGNVLAGWIVGRHPVRRDSLVVITAPRDGRSDLALIEAARLLVARSVYTQTPEQSVLLVIGDDPAPALRLWNRDLISGAVRVGEGPGAFADVTVQALRLGEPGELAERLFRATVRRTDPPGSIYTPRYDLAE
ncbi:MAG: hypothetical protein AAF791_14170 [Bacteroidota bacterium]